MYSSPPPHRFLAPLSPPPRLFLASSSPPPRLLLAPSLYGVLQCVEVLTGYVTPPGKKHCDPELSLVARPPQPGPEVLITIVIITFGRAAMFCLIPGSGVRGACMVARRRR